MTKTAEVADVLLPATSWGEHGGVFTCADRGFQRFEKAIEPKYNGHNSRSSSQICWLFS